MIAVTSIVVAMMLAGPVAASDIRALVEQALDEPARIVLEDVRLAAAIDQVTEQTGVKISMSPEVMALVPHGGETLIKKVDIANIPLREGLAKLFGPLGMTCKVVGDHVVVVPKQALVALGRTPTWEELETLRILSATLAGMDHDVLFELKGRLQFRTGVADPRVRLAAALRSVGAGPGDEVLTIACDELGWAWYPSGRNIVVVTKEQQVQRLLRKPIRINLSNRPLIDVLIALGDSVGVTIRTEPGVLVSLPPHVQRNFSLTIRDQTAEQALEKIAAYTGLGYFIVPDGVVFYAGSPQEASRFSLPSSETRDGSAMMANAYVGKMVVELDDGRKIEWFIRLDDLPEDLRAMRARDLEAMFQALRHRKNHDR